MELPPDNRGVGLAGANPAFMLFGKQIKGPLPTKEIKEELSPRGVDERNVSLATSSDEEEDLNASVEATWEDAMSTHTTMEKSSAQTTKMHWEAQKSSQGETCASAKMQWRKRKIAGLKGDCLVPQSFTAEVDLKKQQNNNERIMCLGGGGGIEGDKHTSTEEELKLEGDMPTRKRQAGLWSRCPRCNSSDTKFCYFNNYNVNQPRHFCKHCQRYWTAGGTLRNVPVGAGKRKNKHALRKEVSSMSPVCASSSMDAPVEYTDSIHNIKSGPADVNIDVPAERKDEDGQIRSEQLCVLGMPPVNTNLELFVHQRASLPINTSCTESQRSFPPHKPLHCLTPLHSQLQMGNLPTRSSPICPGSFKCSEQCSEMPTKDRSPCLDHPATSDDCEARRYPGGGYSRFSGMTATLADERSKFASAGLSHISANWRSEAGGRSGSSGISNGSAYLRGGSCADEGSGLAKEATDLASGGRPQYLRHVQNGSCQPNADDLPSTNRSACHPQTNPSFHHPLTLTPSPILAQQKLPSLDPNMWSHFYRLDTLAPLAYSHHLKPILTPQGWAFPFIPPNSEAPSSPK